MSDSIVIKGAKQHNLKNIDLEIPRNKLVVITGLSGSGKSSLAFDTIYAEGQRRYVESLSAYARQFLGQMDKPDVEYIEGLSPAISIDQKGVSKNPRSTVGTVTEIYDYLRLLFARIGKPHCYKCGRPIEQQTVEQIVDRVMQLPENTRLLILAPVVRGRKGEYKSLLKKIQKDGFVRVRINGEMHEITDDVDLDKNKKHTIEVVVDRIMVKQGSESRLADSTEIALNLADGLVVVSLVDGEDMLFSEKLACPDCGISFEEMTPRMFSFNSPYGACSDCDGLGMRMEVDPDLVLDKTVSIDKGAVRLWGDNRSRYYPTIMRAVCKKYNIRTDVPVGDLSEQEQNIIMYGTGNETVTFDYENTYGRTRTHVSRYEGVCNLLERHYRESQSEAARSYIEEFMSSVPCQTCEGKRLRPESLAVAVGSKSIYEWTAMSVGHLMEFVAQISLTEREQTIAHRIIKEINQRLGFLVNVGLDYLTLSREAGTLSGGEAQRIRLATQIGSRLVGVLYILDEPSIGLHQRDNKRLLNTLQELKDLGNTVIVVEHDEETIRMADHIIDIGPGAGIHGGYVVAHGTPDDIMKEKNSLTGLYLNGEKCIETPYIRSPGNGTHIEIRGAREHNLQNINVTFPLGTFICVTGVSGSGKSTLVNEILYKALMQKLYKNTVVKPGEYDSIVGLEHIDKVINVDQSPIGRTPRSNPATYTKIFDTIRDVFAETTMAKMRGYAAGRFSFNVKGGRCEACRGDGVLKVEMHFLPDVYVPCEVCHGKRYNRETLEVKYKGKSIADVLEMTVEQGLDFFQNIPRIRRKLETLYDVGLGYITLGQPATTLSGGEAQRVKLATELSKRSTGRTVYILDEPTTGLHFADIDKLLHVLFRLKSNGDTVVVIEHNLDVIKCADYIIDLGPEGGDLGGQVVAVGTPEEVADNPKSYTGMFLRKILNEKDGLDEPGRQDKTCAG
jgi:excinuclease ABC subunit A